MMQSQPKKLGQAEGSWIWFCLRLGASGVYLSYKLRYERILIPGHLYRTFTKLHKGMFWEYLINNCASWQLSLEWELLDTNPQALCEYSTYLIIDVWSVKCKVYGVRRGIWVRTKAILFSRTVSHHKVHDGTTLDPWTKQHASNQPQVKNNIWTNTKIPRKVRSKAFL